jgi:hypothetical protein
MYSANKQQRRSPNEGSLRLKLTSRHDLVRLLLLAICLLFVTNDFGQISRNVDAVELTQADLFGLPDWKSKPVAVDGFTLGISREQAFEIAKARHLSLTPNGPPTRIRDLTAPCTQASCSVGQIYGNSIGVDLSFDSDRLTKIKVSVPVDAFPEVKKVNIAREFKGLTRQFFNDYSDTLRNKILGPAKGKETHDRLSTGQESSYTQIEYDYLTSGITFMSP